MGQDRGYGGNRYVAHHLLHQPDKLAGVEVKQSNDEKDEKESASFMANWMTFAVAYPTRNADPNRHSTRDMVAAVASACLVAAV
jgi:hypothetical protein